MKLWEKAVISLCFIFSLIMAVIRLIEKLGLDINFLKAL
jgi:hypothetical protein